MPEESMTVLPYGMGRSYGDCCLNDGSALIATHQLNRFIDFDPHTGILRCESGVTFQEIAHSTVPRGWFLPVTPGTQFVTVGGAIANDVHGKNHHRAGTFGRHLTRFELLRSDGERLLCSPDDNRELFCATIAGLGLTGIITWAEFKLQPVRGPYIDVESIKFGSLDEFFEISADSDREFEYTVAWLDCVSSGDKFGRGVFLRGNPADAPADAVSARSPAALLSVPFDAPSWALNSYSVKAFNAAYYGKQFEKIKKFRSHYRPFFYPLDAVQHWNRIYGTRGFFQYQCVVPEEHNNRAIRSILNSIVQSRGASFLAVLKRFGEIESPGMLSFPRPGITLCLDFPNHGDVSLEFMRELDRMTREVGGAQYPAKDATMAPQSFRQYYPRLREFEQYRDPRYSSSLWRRLMEGTR
jgi:FAD/FMN-containing dehydrogenase